MARISFTAPERGGLLAKAVLAAVEETGNTGEVAPLTVLAELATALDDGNGREFDERLVTYFRDVALEAAGLAPAGPVDGQVELEPETAAENG